MFKISDVLNIYLSFSFEVFRTTFIKNTKYENSELFCCVSPPGMIIETKKNVIINIMMICVNEV